MCVFTTLLRLNGKCIYMAVRGETEVCCLVSKAALNWQADSSTAAVPKSCCEYLAGLHLGFWTCYFIGDG